MLNCTSRLGMRSLALLNSAKAPLLSPFSNKCRPRENRSRASARASLAWASSARAVRTACGARMKAVANASGRICASEWFSWMSPWRAARDGLPLTGVTVSTFFAGRGRATGGPDEKQQVSVSARGRCRPPQP